MNMNMRIRSKPPCWEQKFNRWTNNEI